MSPVTNQESAMLKLRILPSRLYGSGISRDGVLVNEVGAVYERIEAGTHGGWLDAGKHKGVTGVYLPDKGMFYSYTDQAEYPAGRHGGPSVRSFGPFVVAPGCAYGLYLLPGAVVIHATYGTPIGNSQKDGIDWYPDEDLGARLRKMSPADIEQVLHTWN